jgi:hypothetical protein
VTRQTLDPNPFCERSPYQPKFWSNTWWQTAAHCPRHFYYAVIRGLSRSGASSSVHLTFGSLIHEGADVFSKARAAGADTELATEFALDHVLKASWPEGAKEDIFGGTYGPVFQCNDRTRTNSKKGITRCPWSKAEHLNASHEVCPGCGGPITARIAYLCAEKVKNRRTLARAVVALCDYFTAGSVRPRVLPDGRIGSEYRWFQPLPIQTPDGDTYMMTGSMDGVASAPGVATLIPEYKSTQREPDAKFWTSYEMSPQVHTYSWAGNREFGKGTRVMVYAIHVGVGFVEVYPKSVYLSPNALAEWEAELAHKVQEFELRAALALKAEEEGRDPATAYPRNLAACNSLPGASTTPCPFRDFCRLDPADRETFLAGNFSQSDYNPLGAKGAEGTPQEDA